MISNSVTGLLDMSVGTGEGGGHVSTIPDLFLF